MVKKLNRKYVLDNLSAAESRLEDGVAHGLVESERRGDDNVIDPALYDSIVESKYDGYNAWMDLLICRSYENLRSSPRALFQEIADIYELFGCPGSIRTLVYFEPADGISASEHSLLADIEFYCKRAKQRLVS